MPEMPAPTIRTSTCSMAPRWAPGWSAGCGDVGIVRAPRMAGRADVYLHGEVEGRGKTGINCTRSAERWCNVHMDWPSPSERTRELMRQGAEIVLNFRAEWLLELQEA